MTIKNCLRFSLPFVALFAFAGVASAQGTSTAPTLEMHANVTTAVQLFISTDVANEGATVQSFKANEFLLDMGNVNGLGLGNTTTNVNVTTNGSGAIYSTPINLTPVYSGYDAGQTGFVMVRAGGSADDDLALEGGSDSTMAGIGGTPVLVFTGATDGSLNTRYVGVFISRNESLGAKTATLVYELTIN